MDEDVEAKFVDTSDWPTLTVKGGPSPHGIQITIDGRELRVARCVIVLDVNDVVRVYTQQFLKVDLEIEGTPIRVEEGEVSLINEMPHLDA